MERLTDKNPFNQAVSYGACASVQCSGGCDTCKMNQLIERLAEYEDTGLTPEQVVELITPDTVKIRRMERIMRQVEEHGGVDHLIALDVAACDGRVAILPCKKTITIYLIESVYNGRKKVKEVAVPADIDHFTIGENGPVITACTRETNHWYEALEPGDYYMTLDDALAEIEKGRNK